MKQRFCKKLSICSGFALLVLSPGPAPAQQVQRNPIVVHATSHATTPRALRDMTPVPWHNASKVMPRPRRAPRPHISLVPDASVQGEVQSEVLPQVGTTSLLNFDGITAAQGGSFVPPDTNASVGATQVVEAVNVAFAVYDKTTGAQIMAPTNIQTLYAPLVGTQCRTGNITDPVATYDKAAGRWVITMFAFNNSFTDNELCVAVSTSPDATGSFNAYSFSFGTDLPDYPKLGVWPDAYYVTANNFPGNGFFTGALTCALDRTAMLAGSAATRICFQRGTSDASLLPADLDGATPPPPGSPNYQLELGTSTTLNLFKFHVDFAVPANSTFTGPTVISVPAYTDVCVNTRMCIPQPAPGEKLDALGERLMHRLAYRNFGTHEVLVVNHSIKATGIGHAVAAIRWYELRSPGSVPVVFQRGTVGGGTITVSRWMGSIAMDKKGDIALGFSRSSSTVKPGISYVGRVPSDPLNTMESPKLIVAGNGVQLAAVNPNAKNRWGDYSSMAIDPVDDCTFWYAQEYYKTTGAFNWTTRLASFKFPGCFGGVPAGAPHP